MVTEETCCTTSPRGPPPPPEDHHLPQRSSHQSGHPGTPAPRGGTDRRMTDRRMTDRRMTDRQRGALLDLLGTGHVTGLQPATITAAISLRTASRFPRGPERRWGRAQPAVPDPKPILQDTLSPSSVSAHGGSSIAGTGDASGVGEWERGKQTKQVTCAQFLVVRQTLQRTVRGKDIRRRLGWWPFLPTAFDFAFDRVI